ncbi:hypothetical protein NDU88_006514 [Pleurodeles waltl]|uniref:Uncharacterized protein n=1 Tax=Pleurodeles waltl TaxID=8319 RepID=A0AAV7L7I7_PLEWA|nr:hypothetical protein NDU88_006514 [Pleurodeles waltl]
MCCNETAGLVKLVRPRPSCRTEPTATVVICWDSLRLRLPEKDGSIWSRPHAVAVYNFITFLLFFFLFWRLIDVLYF